MEGKAILALFDRLPARKLTVGFLVSVPMVVILEAAAKFEGRDRRRIKREINKAVRKALKR